MLPVINSCSGLHLTRTPQGAALWQTGAANAQTGRHTCAQQDPPSSPLGKSAVETQAVEKVTGPSRRSSLGNIEIYTPAAHAPGVAAMAWAAPWNQPPPARCMRSDEEQNDLVAPNTRKGGLQGIAPCGRPRRCLETWEPLRAPLLWNRGMCGACGGPRRPQQ